ncbi:hypothetical protein MNBD_GAMMA18-2228 [hydrothermal vent metagenome]|uniref:Lcl C-terminal domain-containing protein n=1 Tax=hydrothermal vent metagenome TaxID=652676 RepID=A0A3B0ZQ08_9ZZZZ
MRFSSTSMLLIMLLLVACSDSDHYPMPPEYDYDLPEPEADKEQKSPPSNNMLSIALSMGEKPPVAPQLQQKPKTPETGKTPPAAARNEKNKPAPVTKQVAIAAPPVEKKPLAIPPATAEKSAPAPAKPTTISNDLKELNFSSAAKEKKITTVKLKSEESTRSRKRETSLYSSSERGRFQKTGNRGAVISTESEQWFCVKDNANGVLWEAKTTGKQRHSQHTYSIEGNIGSCGQSQCSPQRYINHLNKIKLCGRSNWRLPKKRELTLLAKNQHNQGETAIDGHYFPNTQASYYWSSTPFEYANNRTWAVDFSSGFEKSQAKTRAFHLRLVSSD